MDQAIARRIAQDGHVGQRDRAGDPLIEHVERVVAAVPPEARPTAWLHDVLERTGMRPDELSAHGLAPVERAALLLLTREPDESYEMHVLRIAHATGPAGDLARTVKVADLRDHIRREQEGHLAPDAPPYRWALRHIVIKAVPTPALAFLPPLAGAG
jgi:hypothetical protein